MTNVSTTKELSIELTGSITVREKLQSRINSIISALENLDKGRYELVTLINAHEIVEIVKEEFAKAKMN